MTRGLLPADLTPQGKMDRAVLPPPGRDRAAAADEPPGCETERVLRAVWGKAFGGVFGPDDRFFDDLGGSSLLAMTMCDDAGRAPGRPVSPADLYAADTPPPAGRAARLPRGGRLPLSAAPPP